MGKTKRESSREESFHKHYAAIWGEQRWHDSVHPGLARPTRHAALVNGALPDGMFPKVLEDNGMSIDDLEPVPLVEGDEAVSENSTRPLVLARRPNKTPGGNVAEFLSFPQPRLAEDPVTKSQLMTHWNMDAASILASKILEVKGGEKVLDLCAAPGGKSIALAQDLFFSGRGSSSADSSQNWIANEALLCSNEADKSRFRRLSENLKSYLPASANIKCTNIDATSNSAHRELATAGGWDKILVDAPCSSERHIIHAHVKANGSGRVAPEMANWRPGSTKRLQETQVKLLMTALRLARDGGQILYATCSIEPGENDGVIEKVRVQVEKQRKKGLVRWGMVIDILPSTYSRSEIGSGQHFLERSWAEKTEYGWIVLPDHTSGGRWGPLFFTRLTKLNGA